MIHVMAIAGLAGSAVAASVMGYDAIAVTEKKQHLGIPVVGRKRPTMAKNEGLTFAPVLVEDFSAVPGLNRAHRAVSLTAFRRRLFIGGHRICRQAAEALERNASDQTRAPSCERVREQGVLPFGCEDGTFAWTLVPVC
jgi:hypothetical protein